MKSIKAERLTRTRRAQSASSFTTQAKTLVVAGITIGAGILALIQMKDSAWDSFGNSNVNNTLNGFVSGIGGFQTWVPVVVTMIAVAVILGLVNKFGGGKKR